MTDNSVTIQAPDAPATGRQWGYINYLAREAGFTKSTDAIADILGSYKPGCLNRAKANAVITALQTRTGDDAPAPKPEAEAADANGNGVTGHDVFGSALDDRAPVTQAEAETAAATADAYLGELFPPAPERTPCNHWGKLEMTEVRSDDGEPEYAIRCSSCGAGWAQIDMGQAA